jgi:hypothetical protein
MADRDGANKAKINFDWIGLKRILWRGNGEEKPFLLGQMSSISCFSAR